MADATAFRLRSAPLRYRSIAACAGRQAADSNNFLRFQGKIDLPRMLPHFGVDVVEFPHVHVEFNLLASDGRRTSLAVDSLAVKLDSVLIDPRVPVAKRRPLFSRDISVRLDRFEGNTKEAAHLSFSTCAPISRTAAAGSTRWSTSHHQDVGPIRSDSPRCERST